MLDIEAVRKDFPILNTKLHQYPLVYLDNAATMQMPEPVLEKIVAHYHENNGNVHRGIHSLSQRSTDAMEKARETVADFMGADSSEVIFTSGTTDSINQLAKMLEPQIGKGQQILVSAMEHHSNLIPWQQLCMKTGASLNIIPLDDKGDLDLHAMKKLLKKPTALVAVCWVSNVLGSVNPIGEIAVLTHEAGALLLVDAAQGMKLGKTNVKALDCDFMAFSGHKLGAATGIGVLYGKRSLLNQLNPVCFGGGMVGQVEYELASFTDIPGRFEAGTPNYAAAISLGAAVEYLSGLGLEKLAFQEESLTKQLCDELSTVEGLHILANPHHRSGCVSFCVDKVHPFDLGVMLDTLGFAVRTGHMCAQPLVESFGVNSVIRVSPAFYNQPSEIGGLVSAIEKILPILRR